MKRLVCRRWSRVSSSAPAFRCRPECHDMHLSPSPLLRGERGIKGARGAQPPNQSEPIRTNPNQYERCPHPGLTNPPPAANRVCPPLNPCRWQSVSPDQQIRSLLSQRRAPDSQRNKQPNHQKQEANSLESDSIARTAKSSQPPREGREILRIQSTPDA